jgi:exopolysaccharide biosynthesis glucuronosyltransferase PssE
VIFVAVGTQLPFDRLVRTVDEWAGRTGRADVVAQVGPAEYTPHHIRYASFMPPVEFSQHMAEADLIISHAGMGTILSALGLGKPILVLPRQAKLNEHRNDHQLATARRFKELGRIMVAMDEKELMTQLQTLDSIGPSARIGPYATDELLSRVRQFIES